MATTAMGLLLALFASVSAAAEYKLIAGGAFSSVLPAISAQANDDVSIAAPPMTIEPFRMRSEPVTNAEFLNFVMTHPQWRRDQVPPIFAEARYLSNWNAADALGN
ncbi:MAG: formylglycine-generating enzyme family protein, partial [Dokdonella sp.]